MGKYIDLTGQKFGRLTVLGIYKRATHGKTFTWKCKCDCGNETFVSGNHLKSKSGAKSCGCLKKQKCSENGMKNFKHGMGRTPLYETWTSMKKRCKNPENLNYINYGGRGITVCEEWEDFTTFYNWAISNGYVHGLTLDRIDNNKGYSPDNCRWTTMKNQARNRRNNRFITYKGETKTVAEWAESIGMKRDTLETRLINNWSIERALETPVRKRKAPTKYEDNAEA
ncbi:MAG: hypothetical protein J6S49_09510 [Erysipelotrichaceae bacterium]|nr:hypothetical protein [Erysipelotrichaceae bacterium]